MMGLIGGTLGYRMLRAVGGKASRAGPYATSGPLGDARMVECFGADIFETLRGLTVVDFGCGGGEQAVVCAQRGAAHVIGIDIQESGLQRSRALAEREGVAERCTFATRTDVRADIVLSKDAFEHFEDPGAILEIMAGLLAPRGRVLASFGPTWLHPRGGHLFSVFPWSHLVFTEAAQIRWRADFKHDGATRFSEVAGGLNQITIARFERIVAASPMRIVAMDTVPIRGMAWLTHPALREFGSSLVRATLERR
jgi:SAM-dependent methyltransferase